MTRKARPPVLVAALLAGSLGLGGCAQVSESRLNPFNWFGKSEEGPATLAPRGGYVDRVIDNRALVGSVTGLEITRTQGGALVVATGLAPTPGWWDAELVAESETPAGDGTLAYAFRVAEPGAPTPAAPPPARELTAAVFLSTQSLEGVRRIVVLGATNSRAIRR